jgi:hypothetical protein
MKERATKQKISTAKIKESLIKELERIVRIGGDKKLNIPSFFERVCRSIKNNGIRSTSNNYNISESYLFMVEAYLKKEGE